MVISGTQLVVDALRTIGAIASVESGTPQEQSDALIVLNKIIDEWSVVDGDLIQLATVNIPMTGGSGTYTTPRPVKIKGALCKGTMISAPVEVCSAEQWSEIVDESRAGKFATKLFCDYAYPTSKISVWPIATGSVLTLYAYMPLTQFASLISAPDLPTGYARALTLALAVDLAEQYGRPITQSLMQQAQAARADLAAANVKALGNDIPPRQPMPQSPDQQKAA